MVYNVPVSDWEKTISTEKKQQQQQPTKTKQKKKGKEKKIQTQWRTTNKEQSKTAPIFHD